MSNSFKDLATITLFVLISTFFIWLPHLLALPSFWGLDFSNGFSTIFRNFDGIEYIIIAKTFYNPSLFSQIPQNLPPGYFASHFLGYPIFIATLAPILGYLKSMLFVSLLSTVFASWAFYFLVRDFKLTQKPLFLTLIFLILPARWIIVRSVGSSEPTFILFIILTIYYFMKFEQSKRLSHIFTAGVFGLLCQLTRPPGILLFIALMLSIHYRFYIQSKVMSLHKAFINHLKYFPLLLIPLGLFAVFLLYSQTYGDFFAYFKSGDNIHLTFPPFQVFNNTQTWVGDIWLEDIVYIFILGFLATVMLFKQKLYPIGFFVLTYFVASIFIAHRDISRYVLPTAPFIIIAFEKLLTSKEFKIILPIILLAIYLYAQNFILNNTAPIPNLEFFN